MDTVGPVQGELESNEITEDLAEEKTQQHSEFLSVFPTLTVSSGVLVPQKPDCSLHQKDPKAGQGRKNYLGSITIKTDKKPGKVDASNAYNRRIAGKKT